MQKDSILKLHHAYKNHFRKKRKHLLELGGGGGVKQEKEE